MRCVDITFAALLNNDDLDYCWVSAGINKSEATNLLENANLSKSSGSLWDIKKISCIVKKWINNYKVW